MWKRAGVSQTLSLPLHHSLKQAGDPSHLTCPPHSLTQVRRPLTPGPQRDGADFVGGEGVRECTSVSTLMILFFSWGNVGPWLRTQLPRSSPAENTEAEWALTWAYTHCMNRSKQFQVNHDFLPHFDIIARLFKYYSKMLLGI